MSNRSILNQEIKDIAAIHSEAVHALREYRLWRDNMYVGQELGSARAAYVSILRRRVIDSIDTYRSARIRIHQRIQRAA